jgi:hypothetical protein
MKHVIIPLLLVGGFIALSTVQASAVVCARGVYRAGCVGPSAGGSLFAGGCTDHRVRRISSKHAASFLPMMRGRIYNSYAADGARHHKRHRQFLSGSSLSAPLPLSMARRRRHRARNDPERTRLAVL